MTQLPFGLCPACNRYSYTRWVGTGPQGPVFYCEHCVPPEIFEDWLFTVDVLTPAKIKMEEDMIKPDPIDIHEYAKTKHF